MSKELKPHSNLSMPPIVREASTKRSLTVNGPPSVLLWAKPPFRLSG